MSSGTAPTPAPRDSFRRQLTIATYGLLFVLLVIYVLEKFESILKPLLIAIFIGYVIYPVHRWLVNRGIRPLLAHVVLLVLVVGGFVAIGQAVYSSAASITPERVDEYRDQLEKLINKAAAEMGYKGEQPAAAKLREVMKSGDLSGKNILGTLSGVAGSFVGIFSSGLIVLVYFVFLMAERVSFPKRLALAFGESRATHIQTVVGSINEAIAQYIAVKGWISFVTGALSLVVFAIFGIDFAILWAVLIFLLNFIPYLGGLVGMGPPV